MRLTHANQRRNYFSGRFGSGCTGTIFRLTLKCAYLLLLLVVPQAEELIRDIYLPI